MLPSFVGFARASHHMDATCGEVPFFLRSYPLQFFSIIFLFFCDEVLVTLYLWSSTCPGKFGACFGHVMHLRTRRDVSYGEPSNSEQLSSLLPVLQKRYEEGELIFLIYHSRCIYIHICQWAAFTKCLPTISSH